MKTITKLTAAAVCAVSAINFMQAADPTADYADTRVQAKLNVTVKEDTDVEQTVGIPFLCELPVLKYIFGTTTSNAETIHYFVTARAVPVKINESVEPGVMAEFDELAKK